MFIDRNNPMNSGISSTAASVDGWQDVALSQQLVDAVTKPGLGLQCSTDDVEGAKVWLEGMLKGLGIAADRADAQVWYWPKTQAASLSLSFYSATAGWVRADLAGIDLRDGDLSFNGHRATAAVLERYAKSLVMKAMASVPGAGRTVDVKVDVIGTVPDALIALHFTSFSKDFRYVYDRGEPEESESVDRANWNAAVPLFRDGKTISAETLLANAKKVVEEVVAKNAALNNPRVDALWGYTIEDTFEAAAK